MIIAHADKKSCHAVIQIVRDDLPEPVMVELTLDGSRSFRNVLAGIENELGRELSRRGEHPLF